MSMDRSAILRDAGVNFSISSCGLISVRAEIKEKGLVAIYKGLSGKNCVQLSIKDLEAYGESLGIKGIRERLESSEEGLDLVALHCKELSEMKADLIAEKKFSDGFGKSVDEINGMIAKCLESSIEEIQGLDEKMVRLDALIYFHLEFHQIADAVTLVLGQCQEEMVGDLTEEKVSEFELEAAQLAVRREKLMGNKSRFLEEHYSKVHKDESLIIDQQFILIRSRLARAKELLQQGLGFSIQSLFVKLDALCEHGSFDMSREVQKAFVELPSKLRALILKKAGGSQEKIGIRDNSRMMRIQKAESSLFSNDAADSQIGEIRNNSRMLRIQKAESAFSSNGSSDPLAVNTKRRMRTLSTPNRSRQLSVGETGFRFHDKNELKEQADTLIEKLLSDPKSALSVIAAALKEFPGNYHCDVKIMEIVDKRCGKDILGPISKATDIGVLPEKEIIPVETVTNFYELLHEQYSNRVFKSLPDFRNDVRLVTVYKESMDPTQTQSIAQLLLEGAKRGGVKLDGFRGVYHWVSLLANKMSSGGINYGEMVAAEDVNQLLEALDKVIDPKPEDYSDCTIGSLADLKGEVEFVGQGKWSETDKKTIIQFLLDGAKRGGVVLDDSKGVYYFVWFLAHEKDKNAGGNNYGLNHAAEDLDRLVLAIDKAISLLPIPKPQDYSNCVISSLGDLKGIVQKAMGQKWKEGELEMVLQFLLEGAKRGHVALENPKGVYYFVWFLAHEKDKNVGGSNYGKINAPKDAERLLRAIEKAMGAS